MITVTIELKQTSQPLVIAGAVNAYQKGDFYCVFNGEEVVKYPVANIWRVKERRA